MKFIKFTLEGKTAFFKKPDVNSVVYYTYGNIHKVALLGLLGAILGYRGYNWQSLAKKLNIEEQVYPEFYSKLQCLDIGIVPKSHIFNKKKQYFNNSVGYASKEQGGNLLVNEIWLENPSWDIYIPLKDKESNKIAEALVNNSFVYLPYLGKNDHFANISNVQIIKGEDNECSDISKIDSLFIREDFEIAKKSANDFDDMFSFIEDGTNNIFKYQEKLPIALEETTNMYKYETFIFTNQNVKLVNKDKKIYKILDKNIVLI